MALRNQEIGARLRELRGEKPQTTVAEELGVGERTYQTWEAGDAKPSYRNLQRLAVYFDVGEDFILSGAPAAAPAKSPDVFSIAPGRDIAAALAGLAEAIAQQNELLQRQSDILDRIEYRLDQEVIAADRIEAATESLGGAAAELDAAVQRVVKSPRSGPRESAPKAPKSKPSRTRAA